MGILKGCRHVFVLMAVVATCCYGRQNESGGMWTQSNVITTSPGLSDKARTGHELATDAGDVFQSLSSTDNCPSLCKCEIMRGFLEADVMATDSNHNTLHSVDCSDMGLKQLPFPIPRNTQLLRLTSNRLDVETTEFAMDLEPLTNLTEMYIENNHIYSAVRIRARLTSLALLSLARNQIDYLANSTFWGFSNLRHFSVAQNQIEIIHRDAFSSLTKLQILIMSANRISEIDVRWFRNLQELVRLDLKDNNIHTLYDWSFNYLTKLETLDLSANMLHVVHARTFQGLANLQHLYLNDNSILVVPTMALQVFPKIQAIDLSNNHFESLKSASFDSINVVKLKLNKMRSLTFADRHAFANLLKLEWLEMSDNKGLKYIDRNAFVNVPKLRTLLLANNALVTLEGGIGESLPSLMLLDIHINPLYCDCSLKWLLKAQLGSRNTNLSLLNPIQTDCQLANVSRGVVPLNDTARLAAIPDTCVPRIVPIFKSTYDVSIGEAISLTCKATGLPEPEVRWELPLPKQVGQKVGSTSLRHRSGVRGDSLNIAFIRSVDGGIYTCIAENSQGQVTQQVKVNIKTINVHLIVMSVTSSSITLTWANTHHSRNYELLYHHSHPSQNFTYRTVLIQPYMRSYTISNLKAENKYQICIAVKYHDRNIPINCTTVTTREKGFEKSAVHSSRNYVIIGAISVLVCVIAITCLTGYFNRRYSKRREREAKLYTDSLSQLCPPSPDGFSDTTPMTYENRMAEFFDLEETEDGEIHASTSLASMPSTSSRT